MSNKILSAEKFLYQSKSLNDMWDLTRGRGHWDHKAIAKSHIEFAKLHVKAALKNASKVLEVNNDGDYIEHPTSEKILNAYPEELIK